MNRIRNDLLLISITAFWGSSFILMENISKELSAFAYLAIRFSLASLILAVLFLKTLVKMPLKTWLRSFILGSFLVTYMVLQYTGLKITTAANSAFITSLNTVMVPIFSALFLKKKPTTGNWVGVLLAFTGIYFINGGPDAAFNLGDLLTLLCAVLVALHIILADKFAEHGDALGLGIGQLIWASVISLVIWVVTEPSLLAGISIKPMLVISILITSVFCTAYAFTLQVIIQQYVAPARIAVIFMLEPVFALLFTFFIPASDGSLERLTLQNALGSILVVSGFFISELSVQK